MSWIVPCREGDHSWDLEQAHLESIRGANFHTRERQVRERLLRHEISRVPECNVPVQGKRYGIHEFGGIGDQGEEGNTQELLVDTTTLQNDIHDIHKDL